MKRVVTLLTDFGVEDSYVAEMKAVLLGAGDDLNLIDISHSIAPFDVGMGAFQLFRSYRYFPEGTVHLAVVDPGVGTSRKSIYIRTKDYHFVGPDNGLMSFAAYACAKEDGTPFEVYEIPSPKSVLPTFHGRDLFAPFVVELLGERISELTPLPDIEGDEFPLCRELDGVQRGEIIGPDHFGNVITNVPHAGMRSAEMQILHRIEKINCVDNYLSIAKGKVGILRGSHGYWEIASARQSAWDQLKVQRGDEITVYPPG